MRSMIIKRLKQFTLVLVLSMLGIFLYFYFNRHQAISLLIPNLNEISSINFNIKDGVTHANIDMNLENRRPYTMVIDSFVCELQLGGKKLIRETIPLKLSLPKYSKKNIKFPFNFSVSQIKNAIAHLQSEDSTYLDANGYIIYSSFIGKTKLPFSKKVRIAMPLPPEIKIIKVEHRHYNIRDKKLFTDITLQIVNRGQHVNLELHNILYSLKIKNTLSANGTIKQIVKIKPGTSKIIVVPITVKLEHPLKTALMVLSDNDKMRYELFLKASLKENKYNEKSNLIPVEVNATGILELKK